MYELIKNIGLGLFVNGTYAIMNSEIKMIHYVLHSIKRYDTIVL